MALQVYQFICLSNNFGPLAHDPETGATAVIDAPDGDVILNALAERGWTLTDILVTHHHIDHTQGIHTLKALFPNARIVGAKAGTERLERYIVELDLKVVEGDEVLVGSPTVRVIETPGHSLGDISYHFVDDGILFTDDTLSRLVAGACSKRR